MQSSNIKEEVVDDVVTSSTNELEARSTPDINQCKFCLKKYYSKKGFRNHLQVKSIEVRCGKCSLMFGNRCAYRYHLIYESLKSLRSEQVIKTEITESNNIMPTSVRCPTQEQLSIEEKEEILAEILYAKDPAERYCPLCDRTFEDNITLRRHGLSHGGAFLRFCLMKHRIEKANREYREEIENSIKEELEKTIKKEEENTIKEEEEEEENTIKEEEEEENIIKEEEESN